MSDSDLPSFEFGYICVTCRQDPPGVCVLCKEVLVVIHSHVVKNSEHPHDTTTIELNPALDICSNFQDTNHQLVLMTNHNGHNVSCSLIKHNQTTSETADQSLIVLCVPSWFHAALRGLQAGLLVDQDPELLGPAVNHGSLIWRFWSCETCG